MGGEYVAFEADDVADVQQFEELPFRFGYLIAADVELDVAGAVAEHAERGLAVVANDHDAAGDAHVFLARFEGFRIVPDICRMVVPFKALAEGRVAQVADLLEFSRRMSIWSFRFSAGFFCTFFTFFFSSMLSVLFLI